MKPAFKPISYTALVKAEACPRHWYAAYRMQLGDSGSAVTYQGNAAHEHIEAQIKTYIAEPADANIPDGLPGKLISRLATLGGKMAAESWLTVRRDGSFSPYGEVPYIRCKVDFTHTTEDGQTMRIIDWKTGGWVPKSDRDVDLTQLRINAVAAFGKTRLQTVIPMLAYTATETVLPSVVQKITRADVAEPTRSPEFVRLFQRFAKYEELQARTELADFPTTPCRHCGYCKMTTCEHHPSQ